MRALMLNHMQKIWRISSRVFSGIIVFLPLLASAAVTVPGNTGLPDPYDGVEGVLSGILSWMLVIIGIIGLISFIVSGFMYLTAYGDSGQAEKGKQGMMYSIIGMVIALSGFIIIQAVDTALWGIDDF